MADNFDDLLPLVLAHEGGYVDHPADPGGATNQGVTHRTYRAWRSSQGLPPADVRNITSAEVAAIYRQQYWDKVSGDALPAGVDYATFDFAVNSGPSRAAKFLQQIAGVDDDGVIGAQTLAAVGSMNAATVSAKLCDDRLTWLKRLKTFKTFGRGWTRRVMDVKAHALDMAAHRVTTPGTVTPAPAKATGGETASAAIKDIARDPKSWAGGAALVTSLGGIMEGSEPVQWAFAAALVMAAAVLAVKAVRA